MSIAVIAPVAATPPGDNPPPGYNVNGFTFNLYGVRVPGIVVSPLIPKGTVDHTVYDHSSVLKTLEDLFGMNPLTDRDKAARNVLKLLSLKTPDWTARPRSTAMFRGRAGPQ